MKAAVYTRYGPPDVVVQIKDVEKPVLKDNEVLLKVRAASVNPLDCALPKGGARLVTGLRNPIDPARPHRGPAQLRCRPAQAYGNLVFPQAHPFRWLPRGQD